MFLNISNNPSSCWSAEQLQQAIDLGGDIHDVPFPSVPANADEAWISVQADHVVGDLIEKFGVPDYALVAGEATLAFSIIRRLQMSGVKCVAACYLPNGRFKRFRLYAKVDEC